MSTSAVGRRYAKALLDLAEEKRQTDKIGRDLSDLVASWDESKELRDVFENPAVDSAQRRKVLEAVAGRMGLSPLTKNTLLLLSDRRRLRHLPEVAEAFEALAEEKTGKVRAEVITTSAMPETYFVQLQKALEQVTGKQVVIVKKTDASLIGGVVTKVGDMVFDGSVKNQLDGLREELLSQ